MLLIYNRFFCAYQLPLQLHGTKQPSPISTELRSAYLMKGLPSVLPRLQPISHSAPLPTFNSESCLHTLVWAEWVKGVENAAQTSGLGENGRVKSHALLPLRPSLLFLRWLVWRLPAHRPPAGGRARREKMSPWSQISTYHKWVEFCVWLCVHLTYTWCTNRQLLCFMEGGGGTGRREIDVWCVDSKSMFVTVLTYYHPVHVYFKAPIWLVTK